MQRTSRRSERGLSGTVRARHPADIGARPAGAFGGPYPAV